MKNENEQLEALQDIRKMMKESTRFLSLSGLSGVLAGVYALIGAAFANRSINYFNDHYPGNFFLSRSFEELELTIVLICAVVLLLSVSTAFFLSGRKAKKNGQRLFDHSSKKLFWNMSVPLLTGGIFCAALLARGGNFIQLISPGMLIFYGLALWGSSRLTLHDVKYLGYMEIVLGLTACIYPENGLLLWTIGFGVLHIIYGSIMWYKYDRN